MQHFILLHNKINRGRISCSAAPACNYVHRMGGQFRTLRNHLTAEVFLHLRPLSLLLLSLRAMVVCQNPRFHMCELQEEEHYNAQ